MNEAIKRTQIRKPSYRDSNEKQQKWGLREKESEMRGRVNGRIPKRISERTEKHEWWNKGYI